MPRAWARLASVVGACALAGLGWLRWVDWRVDNVLQQRYDIPLTGIAVPTDSASLTEGERQAWFHGCHGCHAAQLQGKVFIDEPGEIRLVAPNIPETIARYSDAELSRLIRHGIRRDGTGVMGMPSADFYQMSDLDVGRIIAHLRAAPVVPHALPSTSLHLPAKLALLDGDMLPDAATIDHRAPRVGDRRDTTRAWRGEYLARTICNECHGDRLEGIEDAPPLRQANGYSHPEFTALLREGRARDGRDLPLMGRTARARFFRFTEDEIADIYGYLMLLRAAPSPEGDAPPPSR